ncbi:unnamed protein product, partial [Rotaria sp. Silwood1]
MIKNYDELKNKLRERLTKELDEITHLGDGPNINGDRTPRQTPFQDVPTTNERKTPTDDSSVCFELVYACIDKRRNFLNIVSLNSQSPVEPDIDLVILTALLKASSDSRSRQTINQRDLEQFRLALLWNRVDTAKTFIMKDDRDWE